VKTEKRNRLKTLALGKRFFVYPYFLLLTFLVISQINLSAQNGREGTGSDANLRYAIYREVDVEADFIFGLDSLFHFLEDQFSVPREAENYQVWGAMYVQFVVERDSSISQIRAISPLGKQLGHGLEAELMRVVKLSSGNWNPALRSGIPVRSHYRLAYTYVSDVDTPVLVLTDSGMVQYKDTSIYAMLDEDPKYVYGSDSFMHFVRDHFRIPEMARDLEISGTIFVQFVVEQDGKLSQVKSIAPSNRKLGYGLEEECIRVIHLTSGKWSAGIRDGEKVRSLMRFPFRVVQ